MREEELGTELLSSQKSFLLKEMAPNSHIDL